MTRHDQEQLLRRTLIEQADRAMSDHDVWPALRRAVLAEARPAAPSRRHLNAAFTQALLAGSLLLGVVLATIALAAVLGEPSPLLGYGIFATPTAQVTVLPATTTPPPRAGIAVGNVLPDVTLTGVDGQPIRLGGYLRGRPAWLTFWASWCPPCRTQIPAMAALFRKYDSQGLALIAVDTGESPATVQPFSGTNDISWPVMIDSNGYFNAQYPVKGIPLHLFIGRDGVIKESLIGMQDQARLETALTALLKDR